MYTASQYQWVMYDRKSCTIASHYHWVMYDQREALAWGNLNHKY